MYCSIIYVRFQLFFLLFILFVLFVLFVWEKPRGVVCTLRLTERIQLQIITQQTLVFQNIKFKVEFPVSKVANLSSSLKLNRDICTYSTLMKTHIDIVKFS